MKYGIEIEKVGNGYIIKDLFEDETGPRMFVVEEFDGEYPELTAGQKLLWYIIDHFNLQGTKHDPVRLKAILEKQGE